MRVFLTAMFLTLVVACGPGVEGGGSGGNGGVGGVAGDGGNGGSAPVCEYMPEMAALCPQFAHPCTNVGSAIDTDCGYNPDNGLAGAAYCSSQCGTCGFCRMRGIQGQVCEPDIALSCDEGLYCDRVTSTCIPSGPGMCLHCN